MAQVDYNGQNVSVLPIGKKATDYFKKTEFNIRGSW